MIYAIIASDIIEKYKDSLYIYGINAILFINIFIAFITFVIFISILYIGICNMRSCKEAGECECTDANEEKGKKQENRIVRDKQTMSIYLRWGIL